MAVSGISINCTEGGGEGGGDDGAFEGSGDGAGVGSSTSCNIGSSTGSSTTGVETNGTAVGSAAIMGAGVGSTVGTGTGAGVTGTGTGVSTAIGTGVGLTPVIAGRRGGNCSLGRSPEGLVGTGVGLSTTGVVGGGRGGNSSLGRSPVGVEGARGNMSSHSAQSKQRGSERQVVPRTVRERIHASQNPSDCRVVASASSSALMTAGTTSGIGIKTVGPLILLMGASVGGELNGGGEGSTCVQLGACRCVLCAEVEVVPIRNTVTNTRSGVEEDKDLISSSSSCYYCLFIPRIKSFVL